MVEEDQPVAVDKDFTEVAEDTLADTQVVPAEEMVEAMMEVEIRTTMDQR